MPLHPLDWLESVLHQSGSLTTALSNFVSEDLPTAAEFMGLRWIWWQRHRLDLLSVIPGLDNWPALRTFRALAGGSELLATGGKACLPTQQVSFKNTGLHELPPIGSAEWEPGGSFLGFQERFRATLRQAGLTSHYSDALAGALAEMASNAVEHADPPVAPIVCFEVQDSRWSFGVTDVGRGALASISENPSYADLTSETEALEQVLQEGVSRTGELGRGLGFATVFKALVDRRASLRFRSGGATARWTGQSPTSQSVHYQGLMVTRQGFHVRVAGPIPGGRLTLP